MSTSNKVEFVWKDHELYDIRFNDRDPQGAKIMPLTNKSNDSTCQLTRNPESLTSRGQSD